MNQDGTVNSLSNPAKLGSVVSIWATGVGLFGPLTDGLVAAAVQDYECCSVYFSGKFAEVLYAGAAPGSVAGVFRIDFRVPPDLTIDGETPPMTVLVAPPEFGQHGLNLSSPYTAPLFLKP